MLSRDNRFTTEVLLHGGDYNPEQWLDMPEILEKDIEILKKTRCNVVTLGVFSWSFLEPSEGDYRLDWLSKIIDRLYENGIRVVLATPSGARPKWLADRYPEVLRTDSRRQKMLYGFRHNHCLTSPVYREKAAAVDRELAKRFGSHPAVILWHISNEFSGECHCPLCQAAFRRWLRGRYADIDELNRRWNTAFWSHRYNSFDQIESPSPIGESQLHALNLDWRRFVTDHTTDFLRHEIEAVRAYSDKPVTTNLMYYFGELDYFTLAKELDIVSWDTYPTWHKDPLIETARDNALWHDMMRSLLGRSFLLMESCPSSTNWQGVSKLKKPGLLTAQSLQAIAHGADSAMYFQIRQSRGASEKFHGAVIDHYGGEDTRVIREVTGTGDALEQLSCLSGTQVQSQAAIVYDWESLWAMHDSQGPRNDGLHHKELLLDLYHACRDHALNVDFVNEDVPEEQLFGYRLLILPMVYQFREGFAEKVRAFTKKGGVLVTTFWNGITDGTDLCYLGGTPHGLMDVLGLRSAEIDGLYDREENHLAPASREPSARKDLSAVSADKETALPEGPDSGFYASRGSYVCRYLCELPALAGAEPVLFYQDDFYKGTPALTVHRFGEGEAWYVGAFAERALYEDLIGTIIKRRSIEPVFKGALPAGVEVTSRVRVNGTQVCEEYLLFQNFGTEPVMLSLSAETFETVYGKPDEPLPVYGTLVVRKRK